MYKLVLVTIIPLFCTAIACAEPQLDKKKYISIDEIKPGMTAYCLTVFEGTKIEKFALEVVSVARNVGPGKDAPGRNAIFVKGLDPRFQHPGPVAGCSGSPVYIEGRLAGALSFGWPFSKDALYGVTPIAEMHQVGEVEKQPQGNANLAAIDFSKPLDLGAVAEAVMKPRPLTASLATSASALPFVLATSELPANVAEQLNTAISPFGMLPVTGLSGGDPDPELTKNTKLEPGSVLAIPLVDGDLRAAAIGTVTDVDGDKIYAFGHSMLGQGPLELPIATGQISVVVAGVMRSFKFGSALDVKGALVADEATAVVGRLGKVARTIPLSIKVERFNDPNIRTYNCRVATHEMLTPMMLTTTLSAAVFARGPLPPEHCTAYKIRIGLEGFDPITVENASTGDEAMGMLKDSIGTIAVLMNNPYRRVRISSIDVQVRLTPKNILSHIWSVTLSRTTAKPGQTIDTHSVIEPYLAASRTYDQTIKLPANLKSGDYELLITGAEGYAAFLRKAAPQRFTADSLPNLLTTIRSMTEIRRDRIYYILQLGASGVTLESETLAYLPASKAIPLTDDKRTVVSKPCQNWIEASLPTDTIIADSKTIKITVENP